MNLPYLLASLALAAVIPLATPPDDELAGQGPWAEGRLDNGLRWVLVDAPLAPHQIHFTLVPWGLLGDDAGQAELVHLVEHLLTRSVSPDTLGNTVDGIVLQGQSMALNLRLDTYCPPEKWEQGLAWHADWLSGRLPTVEALTKLLPAARGDLDEELRVSSSTGYTHGAALAAWNQVVRQGVNEVELTASGGASGLLLGERGLMEAMAARVRPSEQAVFVSVGPVPREQVLAAVKARLGGLPPVVAGPGRARLPVEAIRAPGDRNATWDLASAHYLEWYPMPDGGPLDRVAADALAAILNHRLQQRGGLQAAGVQTFASADLVTPEGRWLLLSASIPEGIDETKVRAALTRVLADLEAMPEASLVLEEMTRQLGEWPDFAELRQLIGDDTDGQWVEGMQTLFLLYAQINMGLDLHELPQVYARLGEEQLTALAREVVVPERRSSLLLVPRP